MPSNALFVGPLDRVLSLKALPALEGLSSRELVAIARKSHERFIPRGSLLVSEGAQTSASFVVLDGCIEIAAREPVAVESGGSVGLLEVLARQPFAGDARAVVDTLVLELDADDQDDMLEDHFLTMLQYLNYLARETLSEMRASTAEQLELGESSPALAFDSPLNLVERILTLHRVPTLSSGSIDAVAELSGHLSETRIERGEKLWRRDDVADHFWVVLSGRVHADSRDGASSSLDVGGGSCLGLEEVLAELPHWNDAWAVDRAATLRIAREPFLDVLEDHFVLARHLMMTMARRLLVLRARGCHRR